MTTTAPRPSQYSARPSWNVTCVYDPSGGGGDFAYSVGLHTRGFPELHLPARPTEGADPGADWMFGQSENGTLVNEFAELLLDGRIGPGATLERTFDGGDARVVFRFGEPVAPVVVEAWGADRKATIIPVDWSLHRSPLGAYVGVDAAGAARVRAQVDDLADLLAHRHEPRLPLHRRVGVTPGDHLRDARDPFGPCTTLVELRCRDFLTLGAVELADLLEMAALAGSGFSSAHVLACADDLARSTGRSAARLAAVSRAHELVEAVVGTTRRWREAVRLLAGAEASGRERAHLGAHLAGLFRDLVAAQLSSDVVADRADEQATRTSAGLLRWLRHDGHGSPTGYELTDPVVLASLRGVLLRSGPAAGVRLGALGLTVTTHTCLVSSAADRLRSFALADEAGPPCLVHLLGKTSGEAVEHDVAQDPLARVGLMVVCGLLFAPDRLAPTLRDALLAQCGDELPGLAEAVRVRLAVLAVQPADPGSAVPAVQWPFIPQSHVPNSGGQVCSDPAHPGGGRH